MKRKMGKRVISVAMVGLMATGVLNGCGENNKKEGTSQQENQKVSEGQGNDSSGDKKEISITILERGKCPAEEGTMEENRWTQWINENSPVKVKWVPVPRTESVAKINALFASGEAPDLVWEFGKNFMDNLIQQGVVQPVGEYVETYSTEYKAYLEEHKELLPYITSSTDGQMYGMTSARTPLNTANHGMWIRKDWLDQLGLEMPKTMDELYEVALHFVTDDPDQNGQDDTFGITFNYNFYTIMKTLYGQPDNNMQVVDGKLEDWIGSQAYKDCFTMLKQMYENGILDPEFVTDTNYEKQRQNLVTGKAGIYMAGWDCQAEWKELKQNVPEAELVPLEPVETSYGKFGLYQEPPALSMICMNKDASDPQACMEFLDWLMIDGWFPLKYGIEGENYELVDGVAQAIDAEKNEKELAYANEYAIVSAEEIDDVETYMKVTAAKDEPSQQYVDYRISALETAMKNPFPRDIPYLPSTELSSKFNSDFSETLTSIEVRMISDPDYSVEEGISEINNEKEILGFSEVMEERNVWYEENKDSFQ